MSIARKGSKRENISSAKTKYSESFVPAKEGDQSQPRDTGEQVWCPLCNKHVQLLRVSNAAKLVDVRPRTIYRYIDEGLVYALKVAGKTYRVCKPCLLREYPDS
jgi:excisionase family DNA binding protein